MALSIQPRGAGAERAEEIAELKAQFLEMAKMLATKMKRVLDMEGSTLEDQQYADLRGESSIELAQLEKIRSELHVAGASFLTGVDMEDHLKDALFADIDTQQPNSVEAKLGKFLNEVRAEAVFLLYPQVRPAQRHNSTVSFLHHDPNVARAADVPVTVVDFG